jgi:hypothetical protein
MGELDQGEMNYQVSQKNLRCLISGKIKTIKAITLK